MYAEEELRAEVRKIDRLSTAPVILKSLVEMMQLPSEKISIGKVIELVSYDSAIAAQCLRLANSPLFGNRYIETIHSAIMALGLDRTRSLLMGLCVDRIVPKGKWVMAPDIFWKHALGCALVAQRIAAKIEYPEPEKAYLAGLLHDIGFLVNSILFAEEFRKCIEEATDQHLPLHLIERQKLGFTHCDSGRILCEQWGLPRTFVEAVGCHHDLKAMASAGPLAALVHLSDLLCRLRSLGHGYDEKMGIDLGCGPAWRLLLQSYPTLDYLDLFQFTHDLDGAMEEIGRTVEGVFGKRQAASGTN